MCARSSYSSGRTSRWKTPRRRLHLGWRREPDVRSSSWACQLEVQLRRGGDFSTAHFFTELSTSCLVLSVRGE